MPKAYPKEFREDVVRVARTREAGMTLAQVAKDFGVHEMTLNKWLRKAAVDDGNKPGTTIAEAAELRELKKRNRLLGACQVFCVSPPDSFLVIGVVRGRG